ncbi:hypothetical protein LOD99_1578 [Oopsacas minuta]|uniref:Ezrin/radixin/moesin C-terminal domain-containing protein n=1 Tax=Oopsacas minuta TaxID=111878 RepID=A0AAV7K6G2_9METZ|nr:hypothetical protein LOD99_1578 [Oopsacas minuta]
MKQNSIVNKQIETSHVPPHLLEYSRDKQPDMKQTVLKICENSPKSAKTDIQPLKGPELKLPDNMILETVLNSPDERIRLVKQQFGLRSFEPKKSSSDNLKTIEKEQILETDSPILFNVQQTGNNTKPNFPALTPFAGEFSANSPDTIQIAQLKFQIQNDQIEYFTKSSYLYEQMKMLRIQMESLKIPEMMSICDIQHEEKFVKGETKYSTINKVKEGTTRNRIAFFEEL